MHSLRFASLALCLGTALAAGDRLYTVSTLDRNLRLVNPFTGTTISSVPITAAGTVNGANGLAVHPSTGELWSILQITGSGRVLAKINPSTGAATVIGSTGRSFAGIAFDSGGTLYGVTGDGDLMFPETMFTIDQTTAAPTLFLALGNGSDGEAIAYDPVTGHMLHASGLGMPNVHEILETVNLSSLTVTPVTLSGTDTDEVLAMTHWVGRNFLVSDRFDDLFVVSASGVMSQIATLDHSSVKGLAFVPAANTAFFRPYGDGCPSSGYIPVLDGVGSPAPGAAVTANVCNGPGGAPGGLAFGLGTGSIALRPGCLIQILPLANVILPIALGGTGAGTGATSVPLQIPASVLGDLYLQVALFDGVGLILTNPEQVHIQ